jgi:plasmid stability protein
VRKTTVYLPDDLLAAVKRAARDRGVSEAEVIRESVRAAVMRPGGVAFGALAGRIRYSDADFEGLDPEIQALFYGDDAAPR